MVDRVGKPSAVLAPMLVAGEHRPARQSRAPVERHLDDIPEPDHHGIGHFEACGVQHRAVVFHQVGLLGEHEAYRTAARHHRERLVRCVQHQRAPHRRDPSDPLQGPTPEIAGREEPAGASDASPAGPSLLGSHILARLRPAPCEVVQHIGGDRRMICVAVLGEHAEPEVLATRHREERAVAPPAAGGGAPRLADSGDPQPRPTCDHDADSQPRGHTATERRGAQRGSFGRPSTISPMMFRCTCDEPA